MASGAALAPETPALRFVQGPDGHLVFDVSEKLPGRGAWLTPDRGSLVAALKKNAFARALKEPVTLPPSSSIDLFADVVDDALQKKALSALGLARRAGALAAGKDAAKEVKHKALAYLTPMDGSEGEIAKIAALLARSGAVPHIPLPLRRDVLGHALGRDSVHFVLLRHPAGIKALAATTLWTHFPTR